MSIQNVFFLTSLIKSLDTYPSFWDFSGILMSTKRYRCLKNCFWKYKNFCSIDIILEEADINIITMNTEMRNEIKMKLNPGLHTLLFYFKTCEIKKCFQQV